MLKWLSTISIFAALLGCGTDHRSKKTIAPSQELEDKADLYAELVSSHQTAEGFILADKCDSLLFSSLLSAARPDLQIDILAARDAEGAWHRRPGFDCGPSFENSRSTISRDMILGLMMHLYINQDLSSAVELMEDLKSNLYMLKGQGTVGELLMTPAMLNTLALIIKELGGPRYEVELALPVIFSKGTGYVAHLTAWHIHLRGMLLGSLTSGQLDIIKDSLNRNPNNPLFQAVFHRYTDGNQIIAAHLLLNAAEWPADRLPTSAEHCDAWPIEREYSEKDWGACEPLVEHTGAELIAIYELVIKRS